MVIAIPYRACVRAARRARFAQRVATVLLVLFAWGGRPSSAHAQVASEYEVKAAFLYNFAKFVEWPAHNFPELRQSFLLCVLGDDPFGGALERAVSGKSVQDRSFTIRHVADLEEAASCHMLFVSTSETGRLRRLVTVLQGAPILIVGDEEDAAYAGGMIAFHMEGNRVRFLINQDAVERSGLQVSSQLLKVADRVITTGAVP